MFKYIPHTAADIEAMLEKVGAKDLNELFDEIPISLRHQEKLLINKAYSEIDLRNKINKIARKNQELISFRGGGAYDVYVPSVISHLTSRQEFLTSYTPYQPEISQGTLQYIFEFQSMICELTGMDVSNASVYDGATATVEAMFMAAAHTRRTEFLVSRTLNPNTVNVLRTYAKFRNYKITFIDDEDYHTSLKQIRNSLTKDVAAVILQQPNFFGVIEDISDVVSIIHDNKSLLIMNVDPSTLGLLKAPGSIGADIACGDGQTLGIPLSMGGPYFGFLAAKSELLRKMPGRICGLTTDINGKRGYVLTLQAREQHIRREKATSNICSNQSLMALHSVIYLSLLGKGGISEVGQINVDNAHYLMNELLRTNYFHRSHNNHFFKEFVLSTEININKLNRFLLNKGILSGINLAEIDKRYKGQIMFCATEMRTKEEMDYFVRQVEEFLNV